MTPIDSDLNHFLVENPSIYVEIVESKGSSPRKTGAWMLISEEQLFRTIGGGEAEWKAVEKAREMLRSGAASAMLEISLNDIIGQCCGGVVHLQLRRIDDDVRSEIEARLMAEENAAPTVMIFGAGHVGSALAGILSLLPVKPVLIDQRGDVLRQSKADVEKHHLAVPEAMIPSAPSGSAFVITTHNHGLDYLLVATALQRSDVAYVGMIGSKTKRAKFKSWAKDEGVDLPNLEALVSPMGGEAAKQSGDYRPSVIAAHIASELMITFANAKSKTPA